MANDLTKTATGAISTYINAKNGGLGGFKAPFSGEVLVFHDVCVAGTRNVFDIDEIAFELEIGSRVKLIRDAGNLSSKWAVKVFDSKERMFGFLAADVSEPISRLLEAGKAMFAKVQDVENKGGWYQILLEVYLDD